MNVDPAPAAAETTLLRRATVLYRTETGQSLGGWALIALLSLAAQIVFRRNLAPGEFGTLNTALAVVGLLTIPVVAFQLALNHYLRAKGTAARDSGGYQGTHALAQDARIETLRTSALLATETFAWVWGGLCLVLIFVLSPLLDLPRFSLQLFMLMNVLVAVGSVISGVICERSNRLLLWAGLGAAAALTRVAGAGLAALAPWAESGLAAFLVAGFITLVPALQARETEMSARLAACRALWDRDFFLCAGSTCSVLLALFLFSSADRIIAQSWLTTEPGVVTVYDFDAYQNAGLIARALLWGTQPLLWIVFAERSALTRTTSLSLRFFWLYLTLLLLGVILLFLVARPLSSLFCGNAPALSLYRGSTADLTAHFVPSLAAIMVPLGLLQGLGIFSLASRRHPECFVLGACSVGYALVLFLFGRRPDLIPAYMFGASLVSLMILLFVGVVRWGRKQP